MALRYKLPLAFVLMGIAAFAINAVVVTGTARDLLEQQILSEMDRTATMQASLLGHQLELLQSRVEDFSSDGLIRSSTRALQLADVDRGVVCRDLRAHLLQNKLPLVAAFADVLVTTPGGKPLSGSQEPLPQLPPIPLQDQASVGELSRASTSFPWPHFLIAVPMQERGAPAPFGRLVVVVRADRWLASIGASPSLPGPLSVRLTAPGGESLQMPGAALSSIADVPEADLMHFERSVPGSGWSVIVEADRRQVLAPVASLFVPFWVSAALVLLVAAVLLAIMMRFVLRPLTALRDAARRIESDQPHALDLNSMTHDEIGELSRSFLAMADTLANRNARLAAFTGELQHQTEATRDERDRLDAVIRSMSDGVFIIDSTGKVTLANDAARPLLDGLADPVHGDALRLVCRPECRNGVAQPLSCLQCLQLWQHNMQPCVIRVAERTWEISVTSFDAGPRGRHERVYVGRDITERVSQAEMQAHQERMTVVGKLAAVVAHELNNPLAAIAMFSQMLEDAVSQDSRAAEYAAIVRRNTDTCAAAIRRLLDSSAQAPSEIGELDLHDLLEEVVELLHPLSRRANVTVHVDQGVADATLSGEERQLRQVFINLLINAIQAAEEPGIEIRVTTHGDADSLMVDVTDNGPGIAADVQSRLFQPFFTTKPPGVGTGLGLSTSRQIVRAHGGRLELVSSHPGHTVFRVVLGRHGRADAVRVDAISRLGVTSAVGPSPHG
ncbi:MAG: PAS domain-containing sensor histidine kinase [Planctomycetota bacterium]